MATTKPVETQPGGGVIYTPPPPVVIVPVTPDKPDSETTTVRTTVNGVTTITHTTKDFLTPAQRQALNTNALIAQYSKSPIVWIVVAIAAYWLINRR